MQGEPNGNRDRDGGIDPGQVCLLLANTCPGCCPCPKYDSASEALPPFKFTPHALPIGRISIGIGHDGFSDPDKFAAPDPQVGFAVRLFCVRRRENCLMSAFGAGIITVQPGSISGVGGDLILIEVVVTGIWIHDMGPEVQT